MSRSGAFKVLHVTETLPGGIATYLRELLPLHMTEPAIEEIRVLAPLDQLVELKSLPASMLFGYERSGRNLRSLWNLTQAIRQQAAEFQPHIIHLHSSFAGAVGRLLRPWLPKRVRIVYCPHGWAFSRDDSPISRWAYTIAERGLAQRADAWVAISQHELDAAKAAGISALHARLIYNGVGDTQHFSDIPLPEFDASYLNLLFVGRHDRQKGLDILLTAMSRLKAQKVRLYVAGAGVIAGAISQQNADNVYWKGWLSGTDLIAYYRACDALVVPSRWEGFGLVAIEAMREGRPVLAARCGALAEIIDDQITGQLFEPEQPQPLADLISQLERQKLADWGAAARTRYLQHFSSKRTSAEVLDLYWACKPLAHETKVTPA